MVNDNLEQIAKDVVSKTILAADESSSTIKKRFDSIGVESTPEKNREYRKLLFTTEGIEKFVSGVILYDETVYQMSDDDIPLPQLLLKKGIFPGIKVDRKTIEIPGFEKDTFTQGLDDLGDRLLEYKKQGCVFAKWRAVYTIDKDHPNKIAIKRNASDLALYAILCQSVGIVPIVEPEVLMEGDHSFKKNLEITKEVLFEVFEELTNYKVNLKGIILKPNMVTSGEKNNEQANPSDVAIETLNVLQKTVHKDVAGIAFLSGGQSPDLATTHLKEINKIKNKNPDLYAWRLTASYGRALQGETLEAWGGQNENIKNAQKVFIDRAEKVYNASHGE